MSLPVRRAFSLVELLVVIAIVALLIGLLVPALSQARAFARTTRSQANIRSNAQIALVYANENAETFPNPFSAKNDASLGPSQNQDWVWVPGQEGKLGWVYGDSEAGSTSGTESFGYHWLAHLLYSDQTAASRIETLIAPGDDSLRTWLRTNNDRGAQGEANWIFPSSYWYSPVFWQVPERFATLFPETPTRSNNYLIRRNKISDCLAPGKKVLLFENRDFQSPTQPMWNEATARPNVALVDGSVLRVRMADIIASTATTAVAGPGELDLPSGKWQPGVTEMGLRFLYGPQQGFNWQMGKPAYFWRTRQGVHGRDIP